MLHPQLKSSDAQRLLDFDSTLHGGSSAERVGCRIERRKSEHELVVQARATSQAASCNYNRTGFLLLALFGKQLLPALAVEGPNSLDGFGDKLIAEEVLRG